MVKVSSFLSFEPRASLGECDHSCSELEILISSSSGFTFCLGKGLKQLFKLFSLLGCLCAETLPPGWNTHPLFG